MITKDGDCYLLDGPVTMANVQAVLAESRGLFTDGAVTVELSRVTDVDSSAVSLLLEWLRDAARDNRRMEFRGLPENLRSLIHTYGVQEIVPVSGH